jgi:hypothetical protein
MGVVKGLKMSEWGMNMKKLIAVALVIAGVFGAQVPVHAADPAPSIVVIDTGTDPALFPGKIVAEACFLEYYTCANGKSTMEGPGASYIAPTTNKDLTHGTQMLSIIAKVDPVANLIPIKIVERTAAGNPMLYTLASVKQALDWVIANRVKYNIAVVSLSQGGIKAGCRVPDGMVAQFATLKAVNVPVVVSIGNNSSKTDSNAPACIPDAVAVGGTDNPWGGIQPIAWDSKAKPYIARYNNVSPLVDFYANARWFTTNRDGSKKFIVGTSAATASVAGWWLLNRKESFDATYKYLSDNAGVASNEWFTGKYIFIDSIPMGNA